jgi:hypothetical protein
VPFFIVRGGPPPDQPRPKEWSWTIEKMPYDSREAAERAASRQRQQAPGGGAAAWQIVEAEDARAAGVRAAGVREPPDPAWRRHGGTEGRGREPS